MQSKNYRKIIQKILTIIVIFSVSTFPIRELILAKNNVYSLEGCDDFEVIFARGSGQEKNHAGDYGAFETELNALLEDTTLKYSFYELDYPAVSVNVFDGGFMTLLGAVVSGGDSYEYGDSVAEGVENLKNHISTKNASCPSTKFVLAGYSQGAQVISKSLDSLDSSKIIYVATFGDPKTYLPEGIGLFPDACKGENFSPYRAYVPNCTADEGILGSYKPYRSENYMNKSGLWCNKNDVMCSRFMSFASHLAYEEDGLYADAAVVIRDKIFEEFPDHKKSQKIRRDTVIMLDATASMNPYIDEYKSELLRLADELLKSDGRVAVYTFGDRINDGTEPTMLCGFSDCTVELISEKVGEIRGDGGGDRPESFYYSSEKVMLETPWRDGATKSFIVLTDATARIVDYNKTKEEDVIKTSLEIDPVNFYVISDDTNRSFYENFVNATGGGFYTLKNKLSLTNTVLNRPSVSFPIKEYVISDTTIMTFHANVISENPIVSYEWDLDFDGVFETLTSSPTAYRVYPEKKISGIIQIRITDTLGNVSTGSASVKGTNLGSDDRTSISYITSKKESGAYEVSWELSPDSKEPYYYYIVINDTLYGKTPEKSITITDLDEERENTITVFPELRYTRGNSKTMLLSQSLPPQDEDPETPTPDDDSEKESPEPPKSTKILVPDCGLPRS